MTEKLICPRCQKTLMEAEITDGTITKVCPRCKTATKWVFQRFIRIENGRIVVTFKKVVQNGGLQIPGNVIG